jgi:hypothetical protein
MNKIFIICFLIVLICGGILGVLVAILSKALIKANKEKRMLEQGLRAFAEYAQKEQEIDNETQSKIDSVTASNINVILNGFFGGLSDNGNAETTNTTTTDAAGD